jgi:hypothetical protein
MRRAINRDRLQRAEAIGGATFFLIGLGTGLSGALLWGVTKVLGTDIHPLMYVIATVLLVSVIPLILLAGYFLDRSEKRPTESLISETTDSEERGSLK